LAGVASPRFPYPAGWTVARDGTAQYTCTGGSARRHPDYHMLNFTDTTEPARRPTLHGTARDWSVDLSVVVPVHNEQENIAPLISEIVTALHGVVPFEIVYVDDGSTDATVAALQRAALHTPMLRVLRHDRSAGQSTAIRTGVQAARGRWIATLDGDGQNDPADIPALLTEAVSLAAQRGDEHVLIAGWRTMRRDTAFTRLQSKVANGVRSRLLGDGTPDTGCGLKVYARSVYVALPYFDHMHRFMPALVRREGGEVLSVAVNHRARTRGQSHYGVMNRLWTGVVDMVGVLWLARRSRVPRVAEMRAMPVAGRR
jgi:dolichol-phosphate mannosyltransferase